MAAIAKILGLGNARGMTAPEPVLSLVKIETMRTPQRNFVVEYKSGRRRLAKLPNAIWGNTDFKALVDEAEADAPHLFGPRPPSEAPRQGSEVKSIPEMTAQVVNSEISTDQLVPASLAEIDEISASAVEPISSDEKLSAAHSRREPEQRRKALPKLRVDNKADAFTAAVADQPNVPFDELASLEQENSLLRLMLAKRLMQENDQLRSMLERFAARAIL